jgi:pimeloyl-ACP methyl ester carboxylesterase
MKVTDHQINLPNGNLFARRWLPEPARDGDPTILLFHDSLGCVALWRSFPEELASAIGLPVAAYDRLGFGRSAPHPFRLERDFIAIEGHRTLPALREQLGFDRFVAFGHSVGGAMAVNCAALHPDACAAVITEAVQAFAEDRTLAAIRDAEAQFADPDQVARLSRYHADNTRWVLESWFGTWLSPHFAAWTLDEALAHLRCPILAIHGDRDEYGSGAHPARIARLAGGSCELALIEDCGHIPHRERAPAVLRHVTGFLGRLGLLGAAAEDG